MIFLFVLMIFLICSFLILRRCFVVYTVQQRSMHPTLHEGDRVLALQPWPYCWLRRNQIVIVTPGQVNEINNTSSSDLNERLKTNHNINNNNSEPCIKRVTGLPGDEVGAVISDLTKWKHKNLQVDYDPNGMPRWFVPLNCFFVQGDSIYSTDSREWGPLPSDHLIGIVVLKLTENTTSIRKMRT